MSRILRVLDGTDTVHVLTDDDGLLERSATRSEQFRDGRIQLGYASLDVSESSATGTRVGPGGTFLGAAEPVDLPEVSIAGGTAGRTGGYRAVLERDGETFIDGYVPRATIAFDVQPQTWGIDILASAEEDLWTRLEAVDLTDLSAEAYDLLDGLPLGYGVRRFYAAGGVGRADIVVNSLSPLVVDLSGPRELEWYRLGSVIQAAMLDAGDVTLDPLPPFVAPVPVGSLGATTYLRTFAPYITGYGGYIGGNGTRQNPTLPAWTGRKLVESVLTAFGFHIRATYAPFPSRNLTVRLLRDAPPAGPAAPPLDDLTAEGDYTLTGETAASASFALRHANALSDVPPVPVVPRVTLPLVTVQDPSGVWIPTPRAVLAQQEWAFTDEGPTRQAGDARDPKPAAETLLETGFRLPWMIPVSPGTSRDRDDYETFSMPSEPGAPYATERVTFGLPVAYLDREACYLGIVAYCPHPTYPGYALVHSYEPEGIGLLKQAQTHNPVWADSLLRSRSVSVSAVEVAKGPFYVHGLSLGVGDADAPVSLRGRQWTIRSLREADRDGRAELELVRALGAPRPPSMPTAPAPPEDLQATFQARDPPGGGGGGQRFIFLSWTPPPPTRPAVLYYEAQFRRDDEADYSATAHRVYGPFYDAVLGVSLANVYYLRVRSVYPSFSSGLRVYSEWQTIQVDITQGATN